VSNHPWKEFFQRFSIFRKIRKKYPIYGKFSRGWFERGEESFFNDFSFFPPSFLMWRWCLFKFSSQVTNKPFRVYMFSEFEPKIRVIFHLKNMNKWLRFCRFRRFLFALFVLVLIFLWGFLPFPWLVFLLSIFISGFSFATFRFFPFWLFSLRFRFLPFLLLLLLLDLLEWLLLFSWPTNE